MFRQSRGIGITKKRRFRMPTRTYPVLESTEIARDTCFRMLFGAISESGQHRNRGEIGVSYANLRVFRVREGIGI